MIGLTGTAVSGTPAVIESLAIDPDAQSLRLVAAGPDFWEIDSKTGAATAIPGDGLRTVWAMASHVPEPSTTTAGLAAITALLLLRSHQRPRHT